MNERKNDSCKVAPLVQDYLDGLLSGHRLRSFMSHLERCSDCRADVLAYRKLYESLESIPLPVPDTAFTDRVLSQVLGDAHASPCPEGRHVQEYLDGLLPIAAFQRFEEHVHACTRCTADVMEYRKVYTALERMPLLSPSASFTERVLAKVVPARIRARWVRAIGWGYAAASAGFLGATVIWLAQPGATTTLEQIGGDAGSRFTGLLVFALQAFNVLAQAVATSWSFAQDVTSWFAPLGRALAPLVANTTVMTALGAAGIACTFLIRWMHARDDGRAKEKAKHVAMLGF